MRPQYEIIGVKSSGRVDYAIKDSEDFICIMEDEQNKFTMGFAHKQAAGNITDHVIRARLRQHITELETECDKIRDETETEAETTVSTHTPAKAGAGYEFSEDLSFGNPSGSQFFWTNQVSSF
ncbi:unnamed protein product [Rhizophagus irregularis]|nr:unnamed protein product [Rhizophagus irregularis]